MLDKSKKLSNGEKLSPCKSNKLERQKQTYLLNLQRFSKEEIAKKLNVSLSTTKGDLREIRDEHMGWHKKVIQSGSAKSLIDAVLQINCAPSELLVLCRDEPAETKAKILNLILAPKQKLSK